MTDPPVPSRVILSRIHALFPIIVTAHDTPQYKVVEIEEEEVVVMTKFDAFIIDSMLPLAMRSVPAISTTLHRSIDPIAEKEDFWKKK